MDNQYDWPVRFSELHRLGVERYEQGTETAAAMFGKEEQAFLGSIGCTPQELFDFVEDLVRLGEPSIETVLLITAVRREYFLNVQHGRPTGRVIPMDALPSKDQAVDGIAWLPRILEKARIKLRGEMPPDLMFGCGGDRPFLHGMNVEPADFLRVVWAAGDDDRKVIDYVKAQRAALAARP
jgi:hypothetical protein